MSFLIKDYELFEENNENWKKSAGASTVNLIVNLYLKTKIESYKGKVNTNFHNSKTPKENSLWICLSVILIDSVFTTGNNYYPEVFCNVNMLLKKTRELSISLTT